MDTDIRHASLGLFLLFCENFVYLGENDLVRNCVAAEKPEDIGVFLLDTVFTIN